MDSLELAYFKEHAATYIKYAVQNVESTGDKDALMRQVLRDFSVGSGLFSWMKETVLSEIIFVKSRTAAEPPKDVLEVQDAIISTFNRVADAKVDELSAYLKTSPEKTLLTSEGMLVMYADLEQALYADYGEFCRNVDAMLCNDEDFDCVTDEGESDHRDTDGDDSDIGIVG